MKVENKNNRRLARGFRWIAVFASLALAFTILTTAPKSYAEDTDANYAAFNAKLGNCPRLGQLNREKCILALLNVYVTPNCAARTADRDLCNLEWKNGYLRWFAKQPNTEALRNIIGDTGYDTTNPNCSDRTGEISGECTQPYNTAACKDRPGSRPSYCEMPPYEGDTPAADTTPERTGSTSRVAFESCSDAENCDFVEKFVNPVIKFLSAGVGLIVTIMIIIAGIQYTSAGSDPQKVAAAKGKITNAVLALVTYIFIFGLIQWLWPGGIV